MSSNATITTEELRKIRGLGPRKVEIVEGIMDEKGAENVTVEDLASVQGISVPMAKRIVKAISTGKAENPKPRKKAAAKKAATQARSNGNGNERNRELTARDVRVFANDAERNGFTDLADELRRAAASKLDSETVTGLSLSVNSN